MMKKILVAFLVLCLLITVQPYQAVKAYITVTDQLCNAYADYGTTASGKTTKIGYVAVHFVGADHLHPVLPFGTKIVTTRVHSGQGDHAYVMTSQGNIREWVVEDTGIGRSSEFWVDFWLGNQIAAENFGNGDCDYAIINL
jgi:hypothetical protein